MKTTHTNKIARLAVASALLAGAGGTVIASELRTPKNQGAKVIELHAPNNPASSITVWIPE